LSVTHKDVVMEEPNVTQSLRRSKGNASFLERYGYIIKSDEHDLLEDDEPMT
jgi:hypothetical protein